MTMPAAPSLSEILHAESDDALAERFDTVQSNEDGAIESENEDNATPDGFCVECKDQQANVYCEQCQEDFCEVCGAMIHRTGRRKLHVLKQLDTDPAAQSDDHDATVKEDPNSEEMVTAELTDDSTEMKKQQGEEDGDSPMSESFNAQGEKATTNGASFSEWIKERAKYIPLRLTLRERKYLRLLEAALNVSEYTDKIDILMYSNKSKRMVAQIKELCAILSGLVLSTDYKAGQALFEDRKFEQNGEFYEKIFEIGRRHKIMNPEKMRNEYGKLIYMLQDAQSHEIKSMLGFSAVAPIKTVYSVLESLGVVYMLDDEMVAVATKEVVSQGKTRSQMQLEIKQKERAVEYLCKAYATPECPAEVIRQCLYSIGDNHAYLRFNRDPCDRMLTYLTTMFTAKRAESDSLSLSILYGRNGARLSHSHEIQFYYVLQTLTLWREILHEMFMLWHLADSDLLSPRNSYRLKDTGQGLNRVQACPRVSKTVHGVLHRTQKSVTRWVGSSMIHLGDRNVPNALMFIDKYNQIASILNPVARALEYLESLEQQKQGGGGGKNRSSQSEKTVSYIESIYGSLEGAKKHILADFFRSAFDGSGADNFFDAGSCIDGRLTSAWNWCSSIEKKPFFNIFLLSGFVGFNGGPEGFN